MGEKTIYLLIDQDADGDIDQRMQFNAAPNASDGTAALLAQAYLTDYLANNLATTESTIRLGVGIDPEHLQLPKETTFSLHHETTD